MCLTNFSRAQKKRSNSLTGVWEFIDLLFTHPRGLITSVVCEIFTALVDLATTG